LAVILSIPGESWLPHVQTAHNQLLHSTANLFELPRRKITIAASFTAAANELG
jgi:LysR family glycine cleavage system transcriptional activator